MRPGADASFALAAAAHFRPGRGFLAALLAALVAPSCNAPDAPDRDAPAIQAKTSALNVATASLRVPRWWDAARAQLADGRVLLLGGSPTSGPIQAMADVEAYDPAANTWTALPPLPYPVMGASATPLADGQVLVAGGRDDDMPLATAGLYDPSTGIWSPLPPLPRWRLSPATLRLPDGRVYLFGGGTNEYWGTSATFDPATGTWSEGTTPDSYLASATLLADGRVLAIGYFGAQIYDPQVGTWTTVAPPLAPRAAHSATLLADGRVLVVGGLSQPASSEIYDPAANAWTAAGSLHDPRDFLSLATRQADGTVLIAGGGSHQYPDGYSRGVTSVERFDPLTGTFTLLPPLDASPYFAFPLGGGDVLFVLGQLSERYRDDGTECHPVCPALSQCGYQTNGCGGFQDCGSCAAGQVCRYGGLCCVPSTSCEAQGKNCGSIDDGCNHPIYCGECTSPQTCGGGGTPYVCGCTPTTCAAQHKNCGTIPDGCGGSLECGTCTAPQTCGGGATPDVCACAPGGCDCTPATCAGLGMDCGLIFDGCGGTLDCGTCGAGTVCDGDNHCVAGCLHAECVTGAALTNGCSTCVTTVCGRDNYCCSVRWDSLCVSEAKSMCADLSCSCTPTPCVAQGLNCGSASDGCGGTLDCGSCTAPLTCGGGGRSNICACTLTSCAALGKNCGTISDGCGGTLNCGSCTGPQTCGGGGTPNVCACTPTTCAAQGSNCGLIPDGCGGTLDCGACTLPQICGAGGTPNVCVCPITTSCGAQGSNCGLIPDGCGGTLDCGTCTLPQSCGAGGTPNVCGCTITTSCVAQQTECGAIPDGCGGSLDCGSCSTYYPYAPFVTCGGGGVPNHCGCTRTTCAAQGKNCGFISDGCGGWLNCGFCSAPRSCGGGGTPNVCGCTPTTCAARGAQCGTVSDGCGGTLNCGSCGPGFNCSASNQCVAVCSHSECVTGTKLTSGCDACVTTVCATDAHCCNSTWDATCVNAAKAWCAGLSCCAHSECATGVKLSATCSACASTVCQRDGHCCGLTWDSTCVNEAKSWCAGLSCH